jgi:hypothetical protein
MLLEKKTSMTTTEPVSGDKCNITPSNCYGRDTGRIEQRDVHDHVAVAAAAETKVTTRECMRPE